MTSATMTSAKTCPKKILIVDDVRDCATASAMLLKLLGHECRCAISGRQALEIAAEFDPEIVILDVGLPDLSGYEVARELRRRQRGRPLYLAAVTGWGQTSDRVQALAAGFDQHVLKPADAGTLRAIVELADDTARRAPATRE